MQYLCVRTERMHLFINICVCLCCCFQQNGLRFVCKGMKTCLVEVDDSKQVYSLAGFVHKGAVRLGGAD